MPNKKAILCALVLILKHWDVSGVKILCVFTVPSFSHQFYFQSIYKELSLKGHKVTVITPNTLRDPALSNLTEIDISDVYSIYNRSPLETLLSLNAGQLEIVRNGYRFAYEFSKIQFDLPQFRSFLQTEHRFDLVLFENVAPVLAGLAHKYKAPIIGVNSLPADLLIHDRFGNPSHPVTHPDYNLRTTGRNLFERWFNAFYSVWFRLYVRFWVIPEHDELAREYFGNDMPYLGNLRVDLNLVNSNPVMQPVRANVPNVVNLELIHIKKNKTALPKDLQDYLDGAKEGAVYFSLGSNVRSVNLNIALRNTIITALSELPYKVIWKWESDHLPEKPENVLIRKWLPQQDLLGHPNVKVFVTQGGLQSLEEAIVNEVPVVGLPCMGDQSMNVARVVEKGYGIGLDVHTLTKTALKHAIIEAAENKQFKETIKELHGVLVDQPMTGLEKAVWWIEYVIRHNGTKHLRSPTPDLPLYQFYLLDVIGLTVMVVCCVVYILCVAIKLLLNLVPLNYYKTKSE